ncbi:transcriptional regulator [Campylobacter sp. MIT 12-8780]|uniref:winged helix-turn-helix transcriptional regulator n=1 Tax=unclassified Campylobacter TaxID=2593542 RepID=UPI00115D2024|nr:MULTISPECIES: helix-turn-helix domain-containing protein [unclassified Campylobacter]NDJ27386.1 helix-turn-helix transcriptional regulator [Campylobacter sp. MIT 19-121]TQR40223.1 transcriptional regulator [Campylobacter sp. MIT 12-8780]
MSKKMMKNTELLCDTLTCPVETTLSLISGKYKAVILFYLFGGKKRFNELKRLMPSVTHRTLTLQLRDLEKDKLITRKIYAQIPPKVEYKLTKLGLSLEPIIEAMRIWGVDYKGKK